MQTFDELKTSILEKIPESEEALRVHVQQSLNLQALIARLAHAFGTDKNQWSGWMHTVEQIYVGYDGPYDDSAS